MVYNTKTKIQSEKSIPIQKKAHMSRSKINVMAAMVFVCK